MQERNWKEYNQKLIRRGTIYVDKSSLRNWEKELRRMNMKKEGHSYEYPDSFIKFVGILKMQMMFPYRKLNGFLMSFSEFFKVPDYTTIFRRINRMKLDLSESIPPSDEPLFISIDASGLKTDNGGSWLEKRFGKKRQGFIKIHFAIDVKSKRIIEFSVTSDRVHDNRRFRGLVRRASRKHNIDKVAADPAYDDYKNYELLHKKKIRAAIKPRGNANPDYQQARYNKRMFPRWKHILLYKKFKYKTWVKKTGYNFRTLNESCFSSFKAGYGEQVSSRKFQHVRNEIMWKAFAYNLTR